MDASAAAAAPVAMAAAPGAAGPAAPAADEEKTTFDVVLEEIPGDKKVRPCDFVRLCAVCMGEYMGWARKEGRLSMH